MRSLLMVTLAVLMVCPTVGLAGLSKIQKEFERQKPGLTRFEGQTSEDSCRGTWLVVYRHDNEIRKMEWQVEGSTQFVERDYFFRHGKPTLAIERSYSRYDSRAHELKHPHLKYTHRIRLPGKASRQSKQARELREHATFLVKDCAANQKDFEKTRISCKR